MTDYKPSRRQNQKRAEMMYAAAVCMLLFLALGFVGWYENHIPVPQPGIEQVVRLCDQSFDQQGQCK